MKERKFELVTDYKPSGDQPEAISKLTDGINKGYREQTLLGVTGSGKTFTIANITTIISRKHIFRVRILILKRILRSMMKSIKCVILPQRLFQKEMM